MILKYAFGKTKELIKFNAFELMILGSIILILVIGLYRLLCNSNEEGTWTKKKYYQLLPVKETPEYKPDSSEIDDSKGEIECRRVLNKIFNRPFHKDRPNFLNNPVTGGKYNLELDCVDHELKRRKEAFKILVIQVGKLPNHCTKSLIDPLADGVASRIVSARYDLRYVQVLTNLTNNSLHKLRGIVRAQLIWDTA